MRSSAEIEFKLRASPRDLPELMDAADLEIHEYQRCLTDLAAVNRRSVQIPPPGRIKGA